MENPIKMTARYKSKRRFKMLMGVLQYIGWIVAIGLFSAFVITQLVFQSPVEYLNPVERIDLSPPVEEEERYYDIPKELNSVYADVKRSWTGKVSYYSHAGCIGCSKNQVTASGEPFDENAMTLAFNNLPMKTQVKVINLDNGKTVMAKVNDTGGFHKYNRIADLSLGLCKVLECKTDKSKIKIEEL